MSEGEQLRIGIVSDSHGQVDTRILDLLDSCELVVHGGDIGGGEVLETLRDHCPRVVAVLGNNDTPERWPPEHGSLLKRLKKEEIITLPGGELVVVHGHLAGAPAQRHQRLRNLYPAARAIVYGHSHRLIEDRNIRPWVLNPGACGRNRTFGGPSCQILVAREGRWTVRSYRFPVRPRSR